MFTERQTLSTFQTIFVSLQEVLLMIYLKQLIFENAKNVAVTC